MSVVNDNATLAATIAALEQLPLEDAMAAFHQLQSRYKLGFFPVLSSAPQPKDYVRDEWSQMVREGLCFSAFILVTPSAGKKGGVQLFNQVVNPGETLLVCGLRVSVVTAIPATGAPFIVNAFGADEMTQTGNPPVNLVGGAPDSALMHYELDTATWANIDGPELTRFRVGPGENSKIIVAPPSLYCELTDAQCMSVMCDTADVAFIAEFLFARLPTGNAHL